MFGHFLLKYIGVLSQMRLLKEELKIANDQYKELSLVLEQQQTQFTSLQVSLLYYVSLFISVCPFGQNIYCMRKVSPGFDRILGIHQLQNLFDLYLPCCYPCVK